MVLEVSGRVDFLGGENEKKKDLVSTTGWLLLHVQMASSDQGHVV